MRRELPRISNPVLAVSGGSITRADLARSHLSRLPRLRDCSPIKQAHDVRLKHGTQAG